MEAKALLDSKQHSVFMFRLSKDSILFLFILQQHTMKNPNGGDTGRWPCKVYRVP